MNTSFWPAFWIAGFIVYSLPTLIAFYRHANSLWSIAVLNLLFGWTLIMWFGASIWAITDKTDTTPQ
ncbi:MAG: superinfection immunity protein [Pseudomonadota bacterium]